MTYLLENNSTYKLLLARLFDGHPDIASYPSEKQFLKTNLRLILDGLKSLTYLALRIFKIS